jgi:predicted O-methyltransferase YrrM
MHMHRVKKLLRPAFHLLPPRVRFVAKRLVYNYSDLALWTFKNPLDREITRMEWRTERRPIAELQGFPELGKSAWRGLESLGYEMVRQYRPKVVVELGTYVGLSALAMGLALHHLGEGGKLYAVDTWEGDKHVAYSHGESIYRTFLERRAQLGLDEVIVPLRMTFDEAREQVPAPIDLLHIDGLHTWEAVNHDFDSYRPLVRPDGIVLFHDVNTFYMDMRRFWSIVSVRYTSHMVPYSHGLGILRV